MFSYLPRLARPSDMMKATQIIDIGHEKLDDFCSSFFNYPLGKFCKNIAEEQVQRFSTDLLADSAFDAGLSAISQAQVSALAANGSQLQAAEWLQLLPTAGGKLVTALSSWSQVRLEEKIADIRNFLEGLVAIIEHCGGLITSVVAQEVLPHIGLLDAHFADHSDADGSIPPKALDLVRALSEAARRCQSDSQELVDALGIATMSFETLTSNVQGVAAKGHSEAEVSELLPALIEAAKAPRSWVSMLWHFLGGLQALERIVQLAPSADTDLPAYPKCIDEYFDNMGNRQLASVATSSLAPNIKADMMNNAPTLSLIGFLYRCQSVVRAELSMPGDDWRLVASALPPDETVERMIDWLERGQLPSAIHRKLWLLVRDKVLEAFLRELHIQARWGGIRCNR